MVKIKKWPNNGQNFKKNGQNEKNGQKMILQKMAKNDTSKIGQQF